MTANESLGDTRIRVYQLAISGACQTDIARIIGVRKPTINAHIKALLEEQFIELNTDKKSLVKVYRKGPKSNVLDEIISRIEKFGVSPLNLASGSNNPYAIGGARGKGSEDSPKPSGYRVPVYNVHHVAYTRDVSKQGDSQFLEKMIELNNNVYHTVGKIIATDVPYKKTRQLLGYVPRKNEQYITISLYESIKENEDGKETVTSRLLVNVPTLFLVEKELDDYKQITKTVCEDILDHIERRYGWHYCSEILETKWDVHVAVVEENLEGLTAKTTVKSDDNRIGSSNSDGIPEMEITGDKNVAVIKAYANMPLKADRIEKKQAQLEQYQHAQLDYINLVKSGQETLSELLHEHQQAFAEFVKQDTEQLKIMSRNISQKIESLESVYDNSGGMYQ